MNISEDYIWNLWDFIENFMSGFMVEWMNILQHNPPIYLSFS